MKIYLDDLRPIPDGYIGIRTSDEFQALIRDIIEQGTLVEEISFDHDLGTGQMEGSELTKWFVTEVPQIFKLVEVMNIHSANPEGSRSMEHDINFGYRNVDELIDALDRPDPWVEVEVEG